MTIRLQEVDAGKTDSVLTGPGLHAVCIFIFKLNMCSRSDDLTQQNILKMKRGPKEQLICN